MQAGRRSRRVAKTISAAARTPPRELLLTAWALVLFGLAEVSVRTRPIAWSARRFGVRLVEDRRPGSPPDAPPVLSDADLRAVRAVRRLSPRLYGSERGCLRRSLVLGHLLRRHRPVLRIGVRQDPVTGFAAHAWLEIDRHPVEAPGDYLPFDFAGGQLS